MIHFVRHEMWFSLLVGGVDQFSYDDHRRQARYKKALDQLLQCRLMCRGAIPHMPFKGVARIRGGHIRHKAVTRHFGDDAGSANLRHEVIGGDKRAALWIFREKIVVAVYDQLVICHVDLGQRPLHGQAHSLGETYLVYLQRGYPAHTECQRLHPYFGVQTLALLFAELLGIFEARDWRPQGNSAGHYRPGPTSPSNFIHAHNHSRSVAQLARL